MSYLSSIGTDTFLFWILIWKHICSFDFDLASFQRDAFPQIVWGVQCLNIYFVLQILVELTLQAMEELGV